MNRCVWCGYEIGHEEGCPNTPENRKHRAEQEREIERQKAPELLEAARAALYSIAHDRFEPIIGEAGDLTVEDQLRAVARAELQGLATPQPEQVEEGGKDRWVNGVATVTVALEVPIYAPKADKLAAAEKALDWITEAPDAPQFDVVTVGFRDVENGEPIAPTEPSSGGEG